MKNNKINSIYLDIKKKIKTTEKKKKSDHTQSINFCLKPIQVRCHKT